MIGQDPFQAVYQKTRFSKRGGGAMPVKDVSHTSKKEIIFTPGHFGHIFLALLLLANSSGLSVGRYFCCEKLQAIALYAQAKASCCKTALDVADTCTALPSFTNDCCRFSFNYYKWAGDFKAENKLHFDACQAGVSTAPTLMPPFSYQPPGANHFKLLPSERDITLWNRNFRL